MADLPPALPTPDPQPLTRREREVVELVAEGCTNREIAARLHISVDTVKKHVTHALVKTDCLNRTQLALYWKIERGPGRAAGDGTRTFSFEA